MPQVVSRSRVWFNPDLQSRNYFIPGVIVNIITLVTLSLTAMAIVREKEIGTMEQLMVTPIRPLELILGKTLPFVLVGFWDMMLVMGAALLIFHVPFRGSFCCCCSRRAAVPADDAGRGPVHLHRLAHAAAGHDGDRSVLSAVLHAERLHVSRSATCRRCVQWLTYLNPVRYFMEIVRGVFLQGAGFQALWPQMVALAVFGVTILGLSISRFHKQLE